MNDRDKKPSREELISMLPTRGWHLETGNKTPRQTDRTLEDVVRNAHQNQEKGEAPGIIKRIETELELDAMQLQELWMHLGLPM